MTGDRMACLRRLSTPHLADACLRLDITVRCAPTTVRPLLPDMRCAGVVRPARHSGSVDVFLEAIERAQPGEILVADNGGRTDEACIGDLITLEVASAGLGGILIWGLHRDSNEIAEIGLPLFSMGALPSGPQRLDPMPTDCLETACVGQWKVGVNDIAVCDRDGALFIPETRLAEVIGVAETIRDTERQQVLAMREGNSFRNQVHFAEFLALRSAGRVSGFREYLRMIGGAIEE